MDSGVFFIEALTVTEFTRRHPRKLVDKRPQENDSLDQFQTSAVCIPMLPLANIVLPLLFGGFIYFGLRSEEIIAHSWVEWLGMSSSSVGMQSTALLSGITTPDWVLFNLADGLWVYSITALNLVLWRKEESAESWLWISAGLCCGLVCEVAQAYSLMQGTYDPLDVLFMIGGAAAAVFITKRLV